MRTIIELPEHQLQALAELCARDKISPAEAIRRAVERMLASSEEEMAQRDFDAAFGSWKSHGVSTDEYLDSIRSEWER